jgi:hypothetical protein
MERRRRRRRGGGFTEEFGIDLRLSLRRLFLLPYIGGTHGNETQ